MIMDAKTLITCISEENRGIDTHSKSFGYFILALFTTVILMVVSKEVFDSPILFAVGGIVILITFYKSLKLGAKDIKERNENIDLKLKDIGINFKDNEELLMKVSHNFIKEDEYCSSVSFFKDKNYKETMDLFKEKFNKAKIN